MEQDTAVWGHRLRHLMHTLRWSGSKAAEEFGVTETWISRLRGGAQPSDQIIKRIYELEKLNGIKNGASMPESGTNRVNSLQQDDRKPVMITPGHEPARPEPTDQQLNEYFQKALAIARCIPGGRSLMMLQMKKHLNPADLEKLLEE